MKRFFILMLALATALCSLTACGGDEKSKNESEESENISSVKTSNDSSAEESSDDSKHEVIVFGSYEQDNDASNGAEPIEWIVLKKEDGKAFVISKYALDRQQYNTSGGATWETCKLRSWLNDTFINAAFTDAEQDAIQTTNVIAEDNATYGIEAGNDTQDKVFLLSISEAEAYFYDDSDRECRPTEYAKAQGIKIYANDSYETCMWWLRSPGYGKEGSANIDADGSVDVVGNYDVNLYTGVRPAMWLNIG